MQTRISNGPLGWSPAHHGLQLPFVGRQSEIAQLQQLYAERKHVLIVGPAGVGKTALVQRVAAGIPLLICENSARLSEISTALEQQLGLLVGDGKLVQRKNRLLTAMERSGQTVVFDGLAWTTPRLSSFIECVCRRLPVWVVTRSEHAWDIGHFLPLLVRFDRIQLQPFQPHETRLLVAGAVQCGSITPEAMEIADWLHRASAGNPSQLCRLLTALANGNYDVHSSSSLRLLKLDCRIHDVLSTAADKQSKKSPTP